MVPPMSFSCVRESIAAEFLRYAVQPPRDDRERGSKRADATYSISLAGELTGPLRGLRSKTLKLYRKLLQVEGGLVLDAEYMSVRTATQSWLSRRDEAGHIHIREYGAFGPFSEAAEGEKEETLRQIKNGPLYQVLVYATHRDIQADRAVFVYPVVEGGEETADGPGYQELGHRSIEVLGDIPIHVLTVRIDKAGIGREIEGKGLTQQLSGCTP